MADVARGAAPPRRRAPWVVLLLVGLVGLTAGLLLQAQPPAYTSSAVVSLEPRSDDNVPAASTITLLTAPYAAYAGADSTLEDVADSAGLTYSDVRSGVAVSLPAASTNVEIDVVMPDAAEAVEVAGLVASRVVTFAAGDRTLRASIAVPPSTPEETLVSRAKPVLVPLALGVGAVMVVLALVMLLAPVTRRRRESTGPVDQATDSGTAGPGRQVRDRGRIPEEAGPGTARGVGQGADTR